MPRTGGTTLEQILCREYSDEAVFFLDGYRLEESIRAFAELPPPLRDKMRVLRGHVPFGAHRSIPGAVDQVTILREPVARVISLYRYIKRRPAHPMHQALVSRRMTLQDFVESGLDRHVDNGQTRLLCGIPDVNRRVGIGACERELLERAMQNLEQFALVATTEGFDLGVLLLAESLGWRRRPFYVRENAAGSAAEDAVPDAALDAIRRLNELDSELYRHAHARLLERARHSAATQPGPLAAFQRENASRGWLAVAVADVQRRARRWLRRAWPSA